MLHTQPDFDRMRAQVNAGAQPWKAGWDKLVANSRSKSTWKARPVETVVRGGTGANHVQLAIDVAAAVLFVVTRPPRVEITEMRLMPGG